MGEDKHIIEALGKTRVVIEDGIITNISEPEIDWCPIFAKYHNIKHITREDVRRNIEYRIDDFGMCTAKRQLKMNDMLSVGISEILRSNVKLGNIDCVVGACEGVGTVLMTDPDVVQGVGGRVSGLVSTTPIEEIISQLGVENVLDPSTAKLDQLEGLKKAIDMGYKNIAVTVIPGPLVKQLRGLELPSGVNVYIFVAHTTGVDEVIAEELFDNADIVTACASKSISKLANEKKPYYYGTAVPIFAVSDEGKFLLDARLKDIGKPLSIKDYPLDFSKQPRPLK